MKVLRALGRVGPAFVVAAVVLGPGSVTAMTRNGSAYGYELLWLVLLAGACMAGFVALFMRFGISAERSFLGHCAHVWGRWFAALCGVAMFYIVAAFQFVNNTGVTTAMNSLLFGGEADAPVPAWVWPVVFNAAALVFLFAMRRIYHVLERMMTVLVAVMLLAFLVNLAAARPSGAGILKGLAPSLPEGVDWMGAAALVGTTFSIVGAIFQTYLVRTRGWRQADFGKGVADSLSGIGMLTLISMVVMITSAAVLHGKDVAITNAADMAVQIQGLFGPAARVIFCVGFASAAFSSFLVNAMIGGTLLADGLGLGDDINSMPVKLCSAASLLIGMVVAMLVAHWRTLTFAEAIIAAQAGTLLAIPLAVLAGLVVLVHPRPSGGRPLNWFGWVIVAVGTVLLAAITVRSYSATLAKLGEMFGG